MDLMMIIVCEQSLTRGQFDHRVPLWSLFIVPSHSIQCKSSLSYTNVAIPIPWIASLTRKDILHYRYSELGLSIMGLIYYNTRYSLHGYPVLKSSDDWSDLGYRSRYLTDVLRSLCFFHPTQSLSSFRSQTEEGIRWFSTATIHKILCWL